MMRALFLYRTDRGRVHDGVLSGEVPDTPLYGLNHLPGFGFSAEFHDEDRQLRPLPRLAQALGRSVIRSTALGWNLGQALQTRRRARQFDCVFATTDSTGLPLAGLKRLGLWDGPLVMASQGLTDSLAMRGWNWGFRLHRWSLKAVDRLVVYGSAERQELIDKFGVPADKVTWVPVGVDTSYFARWCDAETIAGGDFVLSVGRDRCRDYGILLEAARQLPGISFQIIASPGNMAGLEPPLNVEVLFDLPIQEVTRHMAACRFVVLPVRESSYSFGTTSALEAMALGKAVLVSRTRAAGPERGGYELQDGQHCRFTPVGDLVALVRHIRELWDAPDECRTMGRRAQMQVRRVFDTAVFAGRLADVMTEAISRWM